MLAVKYVSASRLGGTISKAPDACHRIQRHTRGSDFTREMIQSNHDLRFTLLHLVTAAGGL